MSSGSPLGQLADLLRRVEAKTRAQELIDEVGEAAEQLREAEQVIREVEARERQVRPSRLRELELCDKDEHLLNELTRRTAQNRSLMGREEVVQAERLVETSRTDIERRRKLARETLVEVQAAMVNARDQIRITLDRYQNLRREMDRLQVQSNGQFDDGDRIAHIAEAYFPEYQVRAFAREVEEGSGMFAMLDRREQYAQMKIWIGRLRRFQNANPGEEERETLEAVFRRLVGLSKQHEPGYIEAFNRQYVADWDAYVNEAQEALREASEAVSEDGGVSLLDRTRSEEPLSAEQQIEERRFAEQALDHLKALLLTRYDNTSQKAEKFRETLARVLEGYGAPDELLLNLVRPYRDWIVGPEFRTLRKYLDQELDEANKRREIEDVRDSYEDLIDETRDRFFLVVGGALREETRRALRETFEFQELEWFVYEEDNSDELETKLSRVRNQSYHGVILLVSSGHHPVIAAFKPVCQETGIPCAIVTHGFGIEKVAEALSLSYDRSNGHDDDDLDDDDDDLDDGGVEAEAETEAEAGESA